MKSYVVPLPVHGFTKLLFFLYFQFRISEEQTKDLLKFVIW